MTAQGCPPIATAYLGSNGIAARVLPCALRCGVWAVARSPFRDKRAPWAVYHEPTGSMLSEYATKRQASGACRALGDAAETWKRGAGFGETPRLPPKLARLAGAKPLVSVP